MCGTCEHLKLHIKLQEQQMAAVLKRLDAMEGNRAVQARVHGGVDYVHLGPTPAEAAAAAAVQPRRQQRQQQMAAAAVLPRR